MTLGQTGGQTIANSFTGNGIFSVDLGGSGNALVFSNALTDFTGTLSLSNLLFDVANSTNYSSMLGSTDIALNGGAIFNADASGSIHTSDFTFNGGTLRVGDIEAGNNTGAKVSVSGDIVISSDSTIEVEGVKLEGTSNILAADDGIKQTIAEFTGSVSGSLDDLLVTGVGTSEIRNASTDENPAAYGVWSAGNIAQGNKTLDVELTLQEIQLADATNGLKLNASRPSIDTTLSATITDYGTTAGKIVFEGGNITIGAGTADEKANSYTGETEVTGGTVTLAKDSGFGNTSKLSIASGATVNLGGNNQRVGALEIGSKEDEASNALSGSGTLTLGTGQTGASHIWGSNSFTGTIQLAANHNLAINSVAGIGGTATVGLGDKSVLTIDGATGGTFSTHLSGAGTVAVANSTFDVSGNNTAFTGTWQLGSSGNVSVSGTSTDIDNALGSGATLSFSSGSLSLKLAAGESALTIDEVLSGAGSLVVKGTTGQTFGLSSSGSDFSGTLSLDGIGMTVGGAADSIGANNAQAFADADLNLSNNALLTVASGTTVNVFDTVTVGDSARIALGSLGFSAANGSGSAAAGTTLLQIDELVSSNGSSGTIILQAPGANRDILGAVNQDSLIRGGVDVFQSLIATNNEIDQSVLGSFVLSGLGDGQLTQNIQSGGSDVATGYYDYKLAIGDGGTDLGVDYDLTRVDIHSGQTLTLSESGNFDALLTSTSGAGHLTIASGGNIKLGNSGNTYFGNTTVDAGGALSAAAGAISHSDVLTVSGAFTNLGANTVKQLSVGASGSLTLDGALTISHEGHTENAVIAGEIDGSGALVLNSGRLVVTENVDTDYTGTVDLGAGTVLELNGADALGSGSVNFAGNSELLIKDSGNTSFDNALNGIGKITVSLSGSESNFAFTSSQSGLEKGSTLVLDDAIFDLTSSDVNFNDDVAGKLVIQVENGSTLVHDGKENKTVAGLTLNGGTVDLGELNGEHGQISLGGGKLVINGSNNIILDSQAQVSESGDRNIGNGQDLLSGGIFNLDIFTDVGELDGEVGDLVVDSSFSGTSENLLQDANDDGKLDHVANMKRNSGSFIYGYDEDKDYNKIYLEYSLKEIELLHKVDEQGLLIDASGLTAGSGSLTARVTGEGNLKLHGNISVGGTGSDPSSFNSYTGKTYVLGDSKVVAVQDSAFGTTKELNIADSASVTFGNDIDQTVGSLAGGGELHLGSNARFFIDNKLNSSDVSSIEIANTIHGAAGAIFEIDGAYGADGSGNAMVSFGKKNDLAGTTVKLLNSRFVIDSTANNDYLTTSSAADFVLSSDSHVMVAADSLKAGEHYSYKEISFENSGSLSVTGVTLVKEGEGTTDAVIETGTLDLTGKGTLSVAADIDENFDILADDQSNFVSTLIKYTTLVGDPVNLDPSTAFSSSVIRQGTEDVAYVNWTGDINFDEGAETVGMSYRVASLQLADETGDGLVLRTENAQGVDASLDALVTDYVDEDGTLHAGNITFNGGSITIGSGTVDEGANTYTGTTNVKSGTTVTLAKGGAFGATELLNISNGKVDFNGKSETIGSINVGDSGSITGYGALTLGIAGYDEKTSSINGMHAGFTGNVTLANGHTLTLNDTLGIGNTGTVALGADTTLVINDALGGSFTKTVSGADGSNIQLSGSGIGIYADNSGYLGDWSLTSGTTASVSGSGSVGVDSILGSGGTVALGTDATLALSQDSGSIVVDNVFAGAGTLVVSGTSDQEFGFSTDWTDAETPGFTGTLRLEDGIKMTVGGGSGSSGFYNAANLANADFKLESGSTLVVATQTGSRVNTFDNLNVNSGTISFAGNFDLGATTEELGQLQVGSLTGSGNIALAIPNSSGTVDQTIGQNELLTIDDDSHFQALITAETGTVSEIGWTLNGSTTTSGSGLRQAVRNAGDTETVAHAIYDYELATGKVNSESDSLGIEYTLKTVDIVDAMTLELSDSGTLSAVITDWSGAGTLLITGQIELTGHNEYDSVTRVSGPDASLTAGSSGLGNTTALLLESGASFINEGINSAGYLNASGSTIKLDEALTLTGGNVSKIAGGTITGNGALNVQDNQLQVSGVVTDGYFTGNVNLGDGNNAAILELKGVAGIGTGSVNFVSDRSNVYVRGNGTDGTTLTNTYSGGGQITVHLSGSGNVFDFSQNQANGAFTGTLVLQEAGYNLYDDDGDLASATLLTSGGGYVTVNAGSDIADHKVDGLSLYGGTLDFGLMTEGSKSGQIVVGSEGFATNASTTVVKVALGENNNATGSDVFDLNSDLSVLLIEGEGFDATGRDLTSLDFSGSANVVQQVKQSGRFADGSATAELTYSNGHLVGNKEGIGASWTLSQINLLSGNGDVLSGSGEGFLIDASNESSQSGTISALITGEGSIEFAGGTITLNHANNTYTGNTYVTDGKLELAANEALGDSALLEVTGSGTVSVGSTAQSIGSISVAGENGLSMAGGSLTLTSGASTISSANNDVSGTVALSGSNTTLTIQNASGVGGDGTTISLDDKTSVIFAVSGFADGGTFAKINNKLSGAGTVQIGNGTDKMYLELLNTDNAFGKLLVTSGATVLVNDMHADNALGDAAVNIKSGGIARLYGSSGWTISNDLNLVEGGELVLAADDEAVNFAGTNQIISGGKVTLQSSVLYLGGDQGSSGATNAAVLDTAHLNVGSNGVLHVATGDDAQVLDKLTLGSSGHIWFDGTLGVSETGTTQLGQLKVGSLGDMTGTIHLTASSAAGSGGKINASELLEVAANGSFQSLIEVTGTDETITDAQISGTTLDVSGNTRVVSDIKDGSGNTVAEGTFGFGKTLVATEDGKHAGVQYELQLINLLQTLEISKSGSLDVRISGSGNLLVSDALTLTNKEGETNDYTGSTTVRLDSEFQSVESDTGSAAFMQGGSLTLIRDASNDFSGDLSKLKLELDGAASAGTAIEQAVIQNNVETARLEGTAQGFSAVQGEDDGLWDLNLNLSFTTLRINKDRTFTVSEDGEIGLVITDNGADAAGDLSISGGASVQLLEANSYHGETSVSDDAKLILAADNALGYTSALNTETGTSVAFGDTNQTIGEIHASGALVSDEDASGKLTITSGGDVSGANEDFHLDVDLTGSEELMLTDVAALGNGNTINIANNGTELILANADGNFTNNLNGAGSLRISAGSDVTLTGKNKLEGGLAVDVSGKVSAGGNIYDHIGTGGISLAGEADFTLESQDTADWTWNNAVTGSGDLTLARDGSGSRELLFNEDSLSGFSGTLTLDNWTIDLSETGGVKNATLGEIYGSALTDLTLTNGAQALVTGEVGLETKSLTLGDSGRLTLNGVGAPGSTGTDSAHITVDKLHLEDGFNIDLGIENASVESSDLLLQDSGSGTTIDVATAMHGIEGDLANGTVTVNGESSTGQTIRFDVEQSGSVAQESGTVAEAIYGYGIRTSGDAGGQQDLQITYSLEGIDIANDKTLVLTGDADDTAGNGSVLSVYLTGEGNLRVAGNTVRLSDDTKQASDFKGTTTVTSGATLYAEAGTLGETARLTTESGAQTHIEGDNTVRGITLASGGQLAIGSTDSMGGASDVTLTIVSSTDGDTSADQINHLYGDLHGHGDLKVVGNGQVDEGVAADLTIHGSQTNFYGDLVLTNGAWVDIAATDSSLFGNSSAGNKVVVYKDSLLTIESDRSGDASFYGVFTDGEDGSGGGTVEISLLNTSDHFRFAAAQSDADFTGTFVLNSGTIDFTDLFTSTSGSGDPLAGATLVLNDGGVVDLVGDGSGTSASNERKLGGLTMAGGTIEAGSIGYKEGEGAFNSTINLGGSGTLTLESAKGTADDRQSTVVLGTTDDAIQISDSGSEILNAGSVGANVTVISGIGDLVLVNGDASETVSGSAVIGSDYLHAERPANGTAQEIEQKVSGSSGYVSVAETVRTYDENFTYNSESGTLSIGYKVSDLGLLYETGNVSSSNYADDSRWQGLTITANAAADGTSVFDALIKNGENGNAAGNIVFKGADDKGTITLAGDENTYTGKTWLTENAQVVFDTDSGFGNTAALRVDAGSSVDFAGHDQSMGALFALGNNALKSTDGANLAVNGTAIINGANDNLHADWTFNGDVTIGDELSLGHGAVELAGTTTLTISGREANGTIGNAITGGELTNIYVTSGANVSFENADILSGPNFTGNIAVWSGASAGFAIESGATVSNGLTIGSTGKVSFESTYGGTLAFEDANIYGTLELNNVTFDLDAHGDAFNRGSSLVANAGTRIDVSDAVSGAVSNITLNSGSTVAFDNGTPGAAGEGEVASINLGSSGTLTLEGDVTVDLDINDYADASDVEDAQGDLINRPLTAQDLTGQDGGAVLATLIAGQVSSDTADLNLKTDGNDVEENKLDIAIRNAANGEEVATGTYDYKLVLDKDGSGSGLKLSYGLTEVTIHDGKTLELTGTSADEDDNELTAAVKGTGNLRITEGEVTLVDKDSDYTGSTSVAAGAALVAGSAGHTLGQTSELRLEGATGVVSGASATILGEETVYGLNVESGATLNLVAGSGEGAGAVLTVAGGEDGNVIAGNDALGQGGGKLAVSGDGTKLTVEGANSRFTGITSVESGAVLSAGNTASLGTGNTEIAAGGTLEVVAAVDATSGASRVVSQITNSVTGAGDVVINLSGTAQANQKMFRFADDQTSGFSGNIVLENGGYSLAYANDGDAETDYTANQLAAMNSRISVEENGHLYVSTVDHQINRYIDKHVRALTLNGGNIYFGGLRYDMTSMDESLGGQLQLAGDTDKSATLEIQSESFVNLDAGATNTLTDGSELLVADEGAKIDLIQNAADVALGSGADTIWASSSDEADFTDLLNDYLKLNTVNSDAEQTLTQDGRDVAIVTRGFGSSGHDEVFGVEQNDSSAWDLYLNYHVSKIELIDSENTQGLLITNDEAGSYSDLTALVTGSGNLTLSGVSGTTIALGDGSAATQNDYTGRTTVTGSVTVKAAEDNAFGNTYRLNVESGAKVDFGEFDQTLGILEARGDDALAGTADSVVTITDDMIVTGKNDDFHSQVRLEFSGTGTVSDVGGLGTGDISIGKDYTLVIADENESDGNRVGNNITGSGTVVIGRDDATGTIELGGKNAGFTGNVRVESDWTLEASMGKGETAADRIGSGNLVLSNGATGSFTQTEGNLDWTSAVIGEGDLVLSAGKDSDVTISGGLDYFNGDITIGGGRFELASGNGNVENVDGSNLHATGEDTTVVVADQGTVILGDDLSVESGASIVFEGDVTPGTIGDAQLVVAGDLTITESNVTINVGGKLDPGESGTASLNVQDVTSADRSDELALVIAEADNIVRSGNDLVVLGPDGNPINNPEDRLGVSIVDGDEEIATGYYDFGLTSTESGGRDILGVGYQLMEVNVKVGKTLVLNGAHAADVDYENASSFDAAITGEGNFALANGELTLTGKNTYTGSTLVGDGTSETTLTVDRGSSLGNTSAVNVSDNATLVNRSYLTDAGSIQVASGGTVTLEDGSVFTVTDVANESNIAGTLTGSGALHLNDNVDIDVAADKAQNFTGSVSVGSGAVYNLLSTVTDTVTVASRFESDAGDDAVVGMTGDFSLDAVNTAYHGAFVLSDGTVIRTDSIASLGAADATITTAGDYAEADGAASQADDHATVILDYADRETVGDVTQTMTSGITFVKTGEGVVELSAESLGAGAVKSSEGGIIFGAAGDSTVYDTALTVESGAWAAGFGGVGSLSVASDGAFYLGGVDGYNSIVSSGWTSSEGSSTVQFTVSGNVTNNGTIYVGNKNSSGDTPADSNYIGNELVIEGDYITDGGTLDLNAIIAGKDNSKSDHVTITGKINGNGYVDVNYDSTVSTGGTLEYLGLVKVEGGDDGDSLRLKDTIKIGDLWYRLMWSSDQHEYYLQSSVTDPGDKPWDTEDVENVNAGTRSALAFMQAQAFDLSLRGHLGETLYVDPVTGEQRKSSFWMVQRGDWTKFSNASGQMDADGNLYTTHLGTDLFKRETDGATFRWGVLAGFADGDFDVSSNVDGKSSKGSFRGYSAGMYMTAESKAESGPFLGLQLRWNRFDSEVGQDDYDVNGLSLTAEASWDQLLSKGITDGGRNYEWRLEPHVRAYWTNFGDPDDWTSSLGETYSSDFDNGLLVRVGARTKIQTTLGTGPAWQAYAEANWVYNNGDYSTTMSTKYGDVTSTQNGAEFAEFRLGLEAQFTTNVNVWLEGHHQTGSDDYESTGAMFGFKYMW